MIFSFTVLDRTSCQLFFLYLLDGNMGYFSTILWNTAWPRPIFNIFKLRIVTQAVTWSTKIISIYQQITSIFLQDLKCRRCRARRDRRNRWGPAGVSAPSSPPPTELASTRQTNDWNSFLRSTYVFTYKLFKNTLYSYYDLKEMFILFLQILQVVILSRNQTYLNK